MVAECGPVFPAAPTHHDGRKNATVPEEVSSPSTPEIVDVKIGPTLIAGLGVATFGGTLHPPIDRVRLNADGRLVGIAIVREGSNRAGEFLGDRRLAVLPALRVVVPDAEEAVGSVCEVVGRDARDLFSTEPGLHAEPKGNLLLGRLRLVD